MPITLSTDMDIADRAARGASINELVRQVTDAVAVINAASATLTTTRDAYESAKDTANADGLDARLTALKADLVAAAARFPAKLAR